MITELVISTNYDSERIPLLHKQEIRGFPLGFLVFFHDMVCLIYRPKSHHNIYLYMLSAVLILDFKFLLRMIGFG